MSLKDVKQFFKENNLDYYIYELAESSATVEEAAKAHGVAPDEIAKTMAFKQKDCNVLILAKGSARIDNQKYKEAFSQKAKMLKIDEVLEITGHPVGGVCPFGVKTPMNIYMDVSLKEFDYVYPAAGETNTSIKISPNELLKITNAEWVDVCK